MVFKNVINGYLRIFMCIHKYTSLLSIKTLEKIVVLVLVKFRRIDFPFCGSNYSEDFNFGIVNCGFDRLIEWIN